MEEFFQSLDLANQWEDWLKALLLCLLGLIVTVTLLGVLYSLIALPLWRRDRARLFLDLLETGLNSGQSAEGALAAATTAPDRSLGRHLRRVGTALREGRRLDQALQEIPALLPPAVTAMLKTGAELGDLRRVLPACRQLLDDGVSQTRGALNYVVVALTVVAPWALGTIGVLAVLVLPKFKELFADMEVPPPALFVFLNDNLNWIMLGLLAICVVFCAGVVIFAAGPRLSRRIPFLHEIHFGLPWRRRRMHRDFTALLALLLDADVPEERALQLAGECTANSCFQRRVARAIDKLRAGAALAEAVRHVDDSGEFQWRLANASHAEGGFVRALAGWQEALAARAFQQEQAAAHLVTTAAVLVQGVLVGCVAIGLFAGLVAIIEEGVLW